MSANWRVLAITLLRSTHLSLPARAVQEALCRSASLAILPKSNQTFCEEKSMSKVPEELIALVEIQSKATIDYHRAKAALLEANQRMVLQGIRDGVIDVSRVMDPSYR